MSDKVESNPARYLALSEPFESVEEFDAALEQFRAAVGEAREAAGVADVYVIVAGRIDCGEHGQRVITSLHFGDQMLTESLTAWAFGREQAEHKRAIGELLVANKVAM